MRRIAFLVAYDGAAFSGSQRQSNAKSVQGELERAVERVLKHPATLTLAGRTDAGVHATGQVAMFETANQSLPVERVPLALNAVLERTVRVREARLVEPPFHPRFSAKSRVYRYRFELGSIASPLIRQQAALWNCDPNIAAMRAGAEAFIGRHDFAAWQSAGSPTPSTVRTVKRLEIKKTEAFGSEILEIEIEADAFLYQMVRNIVGALIEVGQGKLKYDDLRRLTGGLDRTKCPPPAAPQGLCLIEVKY
jgi:tRNA pseudouridine38-40 synthase